MNQDQMRALVDTHLAAEDAGDLDAAIAVYTPDVEHDVVASVFGDFAGVPGQGRRVRFRMLHVFEFRDGGISRENVWLDTMSVLAQLDCSTSSELGDAQPAGLPQ